VASACAGLPLGREFPSPDAAQIKVDVTDKADPTVKSYSFTSNVPEDMKKLR